MTFDRKDSGLRNTRSHSPVAIVSGFCAQVFAVADADARKFKHDPWELITRAIQPMLWLVLL